MLKVELLFVSQNLLWCFCFLNVMKKTRLNFSLNIGLWRDFLILRGIIRDRHKRLVEHILFNKAVVIVVELCLIHGGVETQSWVVKVVWFWMIKTLLFERAWGYQLESIPGAFVYSLGTNVSQRVIWVFYYCVVKLKTIEVPEKFVLLLKNVSDLRLEKVHLIN